MKKFALIATFAALLAAPALADPIEGMWRTSPDDHGDIGFVEVAQCGGSYCGTLVRAQNAQGQQITPDTIGRQIVWDLTPAGEGQYEGRIYAPDRDREYMSRLQLAGSTMSVNGCVLGGLICRNGGTWTRAN